MDTNRGLAKFREERAPDWATERARLLASRIADLGLAIEGTRLEPLVRGLHDELREKGIDLRPPVYLADEWGCPEGVPIIGVPFYLADPRLLRLEKEMLGGPEAESDEDIRRYLRHEAGHAFNYAYRLYETEEWHEVFGPYSRPYREDYEPNPFSRSYVRHIAGWYAQKHPDEDFAETFAVWLAPDSHWRERYRGWGCYGKLEYVERIAAHLGHTPPLVGAEDYDHAGELDVPMSDYYQRFAHQPVPVPAYFDGDLKDLFETGPRPRGADWQEAHAYLEERRRSIVDNIAYWTGLHEPVVRSLYDHFVERTRALGLWLWRERGDALAVELTAYATTLCMNRLYKGDFIIK